MCAKGAPNTIPIPLNTDACPKPKLSNSGPATVRTHSLTVGEEAAPKNPKMNEHTANGISEVNVVSKNMKMPVKQNVTTSVQYKDNKF